MLLQNKNAIIYGAGGSIGGAVARAFAAEGARVFLAGRTHSALQKVATDIIKAGGIAEAVVVDALDEQSVNNNMDHIIQVAGHIDISFNAIAVGDSQGKPIAEMELEDFFRPVRNSMQSHFITAKAAARQMMKRNAGVILSISATPAAKAYALAGGFGPACSAIEGFARNLAAELGPAGIRVVCIRSAGSPDSEVFKKMQKKEVLLAQPEISGIVGDTMLKRLPLMAEIANVAVFLVSGLSSGMTGTSVNVTCGTTID